MIGNGTASGIHTIIRPRGDGLIPRAADVLELWNARELLRQLVWRDIRVRYAQTLLGALWAVLQPLTTMAIFTLVFAHEIAYFVRQGHVHRLPQLLPYEFIRWAGFQAGRSRMGVARQCSSQHRI